MNSVEMNTRTRILHAAIELMGREGPDRFSASALAREVGVSKATLFHHFDSLDEIPLAALEEIFYEAISEMPGPDGSLEESLASVAEQTRALADNESFLQAYFVFFIKGIFDERLRERITRGAFELHEDFVTKLRPHLDSEEDAAVTARMVEAMLDGLALHHILMGDHDVLERAWNRFAELLVDAQDDSRRNT